MTVINLPTPEATLAQLRSRKNDVIGNPLEKVTLAREERTVPTIVDLLCARPSSADVDAGVIEKIRIEAAHIVASLSYGSHEALQCLLRAHAHRALLHAIAGLQLSDSSSLRFALARALRSLASSVADIVGPPLWGLMNEDDAVRDDARAALWELSQIESLDVYLPLLADPNSRTSVSICHLLASTLRLNHHRTAVAEWLPPADRAKESKGKRGWEKPDVGKGNAAGRQGGWVVRHLTGLLSSRDAKVQEGALSALAALAKESSTVATSLSKAPSEYDLPPVKTILDLTKSRQSDVKLAACLCLANILRALPTPSTASSTPEPNPTVLTLLHILNRLVEATNESQITRAKACHILVTLISDDRDLQRTASTCGSPMRIAQVLLNVTPPDKTDWEEDEPEGIYRLREASLIAIAAMSLYCEDIRRVLLACPIIPCISSSLAHPHVGVRHAACHCVRALSRSVHVLRTSIVDHGLGGKIYDVFAREDEDRRVRITALAALCNLVVDFSPLRETLISQGGITKIAGQLHSEDPAMKLNALWAIRNSLHSSRLNEKQSIIGEVGWDRLAMFLVDPAPGIREQAMAIIRNLATAEPDIEFVFHGLGSQRLLDALESALVSTDEDVLQQACHTLMNLTNGSQAHRAQLLSRPQILAALPAALAHPKLETRRAAAACVENLVSTNLWKNKELREAGIEVAIKAVLGRQTAGPGAAESAGVMGRETNREILAHLRRTLAYFESGREAPTNIAL